ncbi:hypothetical protein [Paraburkholderia sp. SIMBA_054]|uniref:hypothetical protein n=1 Tax=Paraburkholderia sp. SIMBA_054 TaxID=3085795 RepID=UPI00397BCD0D
MQPTSLGGLQPSAVSSGLTQFATDAGSVTPVAFALPNNFPVTLEEAQIAQVQQKLAAFNFASMKQQAIVTLEAEPTLALNRVLDAYLARINKAENPQIFKLFDSLDDAIARENLGQLADNILNAKPGFKDRLIGLFSKKALRTAMDRVYEDLSRMAKLKSRDLSEVVNSMERQIRSEMTKLNAEMLQMDGLKAEYRKSFVDFAVGTAFLHNALLKAQSEAPALLAAAGQDVTRQQEIQDKLQSLESVALARETMMTRLPAEQLVIRQLQSAGVSTLQEIDTTLGDRLASIRMTLITIHGSQLVQNVQRLSQSGANLDNNLQAVRAKVMQGVVTTAATAPGTNRADQARNLRQVVTDTQTLLDIVKQAREKNQANFEEARTTLASVRADLLTLGQEINPAATVAQQTY